MNSELLAFTLYFVLVLGIGIYFFIRTKSGGDKEYFLGGRNMGPWVTAMSAQASDMSAWLLMGLPGSILAFGLGQAWIGIGLAIGTAANWILISGRLRRFSKAANDSITIPQYLSNRFCAKNNILKFICAGVLLIFFTVYVASSFVAGASVFTAIFPEINQDVAMIIFALILICYTFFGGYKAVCWTDFFQGILMLVALLSVPILIVATKDLSSNAINDIVVGDTTYGFTKSVFDAPWQEIVSGLAWGLGYFGMPHILVRFMSIKKPSYAKKSTVVATIWVVLALFATILVAYYGRILIGEELVTTGSQKMVFIELARDLFPPFVAGLLMSAIIAASMSTADSQLLVASSAFTADIYKPAMRKNASDKEILWVSRFVVVIIAIIAFFIASSKSSGAQAIMDMVENAWGGFGSAFGAVVILSVFWKRFTYAGAIAGVLVGAGVDVIWLFTLTESTGIYELLPGFICSLIAAVVVTLLSKKPSSEVIEIYEKATAKGIDD